jgi:hypothetical protein
MTTTWHKQIVGASGSAELVQVARDYIASITPEEWALLPETCRPERVRGVDDIEFWHDRLTEEFIDVAADPVSNDVLRDVLAFFSAAAERAAVIPDVRQSAALKRTYP